MFPDTIGLGNPGHRPRLPGAADLEHHPQVFSGRMKWRNTVIIVVIGLAASAVFAAAVQFQPLNVSTGLWHITEAVTWTNLPPQMAAMMKAAPQTTEL